MNTLRFYPEFIRKEYERNIKNSGEEISPEKKHNQIIFIALLITVISSTAFLFLKISINYSFAVFILINLYFYFRISLKASSNIKRMEGIFPDVISLMSSNLRAGITIERSFLLSARPEFFPLDKEIEKAGKEIATGKDIIYVFKKMSERIDSEKISKIITLIISGLKSGGNISDLLEETSRNMKEKEVLEKKAAANIVMYVMFIFFAVGIGAPVLFGLSSVLVETVISLSSRIPEVGTANIQMPLTFNKVSISLNFIIFFSLIFMIVTDFISCFVMGLVNKGEGKTGLKWFVPLVVLSTSIFFAIRIFLSKIMLGVLEIK